MDKTKIVSADQLPEELGKLQPSEFAFTNAGDKIMDADLQTVSRGFFKDALFRLKKNKAAIAAFFILCFIIFMAIFGPNMNEHTFSEQNSEHIKVSNQLTEAVSQFTVK